MISKANLTSKIGILILLGVLVFLARIKYLQYKDQKAINAEKASLLRQADSLEKKNQELSNALTFLDSPEFKEQVARQQLNLQKNGEIVYSFSENTNATSSAGNATVAESNPSKWWHYFFK